MWDLITNKFRTKNQTEHDKDKRYYFNGTTNYILLVGGGMLVLGGTIIFLIQKRSKDIHRHKRFINFLTLKYLSLYRYSNIVLNPIKRLYYKKISTQHIQSIWLNGKNMNTHSLSKLAFTNNDIIEIRWKCWGKQYRIQYKGFITHYPVYTNDTLSILTKDPKKYRIQKILYANVYNYDANTEEYVNKDITNVFKEYLGPFQNFYEDVNEIQKYILKIPKYYMDEEGKLLLNHDKDYIEVMNNKGELLKISNNSYIKMKLFQIISI